MIGIESFDWFNSPIACTIGSVDIMFNVDPNFEIKNCGLLASEKYVLNKLRNQFHKQLADIRHAFMQNVHVRFLKEFFYYQPYGKREFYKHRLETASLEKLAKLINVTALLLLTKVYLVWQNVQHPQLSHVTISNPVLEKFRTCRRVVLWR